MTIAQAGLPLSKAPPFGAMTTDAPPDDGIPRRVRAATGRIERRYAMQLKSLARHVGELIAGYEDLTIEGLPSLTHLLQSYALALKPWAKRVAANMIAGVDDADRNSWRALGNAISAQMHRNLEHTEIGTRTRALLDLQVALITSIPQDAAERVHRLTIEGLESSSRAKEAASQIAESAAVTASRALLIARTETSRTATQLLRARCEAIGAESYIWRTAGDSTVRAGHKVMEGRAFRWADPPPVQEGKRVIRHHPGEIWNCRCWAEPILHDPYKRSRPGRLL